MLINDKKRISWIDTLKFICIFCVIADHIDGCSYKFIKFFEPFFLNGFFFASGFCYNNKRTFPEHIKKKAFQLLLPWFIYSNLNILLSHIYSYYGHDNLVTELWKNLLQVRGYGDYLWFIACLFVAYIPFFYLIKLFDKSNKKNRIIIILFVFSLAMLSSVARGQLSIIGFKHIWGKTNLLWHGEYLAEANFYMLIGYAFKCIEKEYDKKIKINIFVFILYCALLRFNYNGINSLVLSYLYNSILALTGLSLLIAVSKIIKSNRYISFIGQNTMLCFSLHNKVKTALLILLEFICPSIISIIGNNLLINITYVCIYTFIITIVLIPPILLINRYLPWTVGKKRENM